MGLFVLWDSAVPPVNSPVTHEHGAVADPEVTSLPVGEPKFTWLWRPLPMA